MQGYLWRYYVTPRAVTDGRCVARWEWGCSVCRWPAEKPVQTPDIRSFKKLLRGRLWVQRQDSKQVFLSIVCHTWWVTAPPLTTSSCSIKRRAGRWCSVNLWVCTQPHVNTHMLQNTQTQPHLSTDVDFCPPAGEEQGSGIPAVSVVSKHIQRGLLWRLTTS